MCEGMCRENDSKQNSKSMENKEVIVTSGFVCNGIEALKKSLENIIENGTAIIKDANGEKTEYLEICPDPVIYPEEGCNHDICQEVEIVIRPIEVDIEVNTTKPTLTAEEAIKEYFNIFRAWVERWNYKLNLPEVTITDMHKIIENTSFKKE